MSKRKLRLDGDASETDELEDEIAANEEEELANILFTPQPESRTLGLYGDVAEKNSAGICYSMLGIHEQHMNKQAEDAALGVDPKEVEDNPISFYISTPGGSSHDMMAIYDIMTHVKKNIEVHTCGIGQVQSAGVLLLAAGTKGKRLVGRHCRLMIHPVAAGNAGELHDLENEMEEIRLVQDAYSKALIKESKLTAKQFKGFLSRSTKVYFGAEEAIKWGIADGIY